jgi:hypothetical protein
MLTKNGLGYILGDFFHQLVWSPWRRQQSLASKFRFLAGPGL